VAQAEQASSLEAAANAVRTDDIGLVGAMRWMCRRREAVHENLLTLKGLIPAPLDCPPSVTEVRRHLGTERALETLRELACDHLHALAPPLGFRPRPVPGGERKRPEQHRRGPDPPPGTR
jgi:hypothetical protein